MICSCVACCCSLAIIPKLCNETPAGAKISNTFGFFKARNLLEKVTKEVIIENEIELAGIKFYGIKVENNLICDGHHRHLASLLANISIERIATSSTSATIVVDWKSVIFEDEDWDTQAKIDMLNDQDANYNNIPIEKIIELLQ